MGATCGVCSVWDFAAEGLFGLLVALQWVDQFHFVNAACQYKNTSLFKYSSNLTPWCLGSNFKFHLKQANRSSEITIDRQTDQSWGTKKKERKRKKNSNGSLEMNTDIFLIFIKRLFSACCCVETITNGKGLVLIPCDLQFYSSVTAGLPLC